MNITKWKQSAKKFWQDNSWHILPFVAIFVLLCLLFFVIPFFHHPSTENATTCNDIFTHNGVTFRMNPPVDSFGIVDIPSTNLTPFNWVFLDGFSSEPHFYIPVSTYYELTNNLTAAQARISELESRPVPTVTVTVTPPPVTVEVPTIPPDVTILWQADGSSDNFSYSEFYTLQQVEDYIASCNLTVNGNCYEWMICLSEQARHDGKPIGLALMFKQRADGAIIEAHFTNFVIIGKIVLRIEPQTGQISNWDGWRLAIP